MPYVPPVTLTDIKDRTARAKLLKLLYERSVIGYTFSYEKLFSLLSKLVDDVDTVASSIESCIIAKDENTAKQIKSDLNDKITMLYTENGIDKTLRAPDPFGNYKDYCMFQGTATSFSKDMALEYAVAHGISAKKFTEALDAGSKQTKYATLTVKNVKEESRG